ncbi:hypothetical protein [Dictyobacter aurantiacus]|nr:hypothetical protein [Dictyobacter aurantiacus]
MTPSPRLTFSNASEKSASGKACVNMTPVSMAALLISSTAAA